MNTKLFLIIRIIIALILIQTLFFKFTAHPDSVFIFSKVGLEPYGRILIGVLELIAAILILIPKSIWVGALLSLGVISGAVIMHLTKLGIDVNNDGGKLFYMAIVVLISSVLVLWNERKKIPVIGNKF
ncbi:DoxX-like protein [Lutibacter oceani]|uniref:DoxX-like protein n=1 Tax=Lutibacter oceani TaxID=1853311 RepID=A0A3D9RQG8_9FLAO|nr:DoxX family protein [Lutibacter oceani]REE82169.1 DoxX-like protein [Lutibacter oceani]